jgi:hypothetical protein
VDWERALRDAFAVPKTWSISRRSRVIVILAAASWILSCLPSGKHPAGKHIIADRTLTGVFLTASETDGVPSHLFASGPTRLPRRVTQASDCCNDLLVDLYAFPYWADSVVVDGLAGKQPTIENLVIRNGDLSHYALATDSRGRPVYLKYKESSVDSTYDNVSVDCLDWVTGQEIYLGWPNWMPDGNEFRFSPGRTRIFSGSLSDFDDWVDLGSIEYQQGAFIGEDFYYIALPGPSDRSRSSLGRCKAGAPPELLLSSTGTLGLAAIQGDRTPQILLTVITYASLPWANPIPIALLDTQTLVSTALPPPPAPTNFLSASSNGHWLLFGFSAPYNHPDQPAGIGLFLFDWTTGSTASVEPSSLGLPIDLVNEWRPGHDELWFNFSESESNFGTWDVGSGFVVRAGSPTTIPWLPAGRNSMFTRDGRHWLSRKNLGPLPTIYVGSADDLAAPVFPLHPEGTALSALWETSDGRLLVGASGTDQNRQDIFIIDPDTGSSRIIASGGYVVALGHSRALAILNWENSRLAGELTLVDLASGAHTILAQDVYSVAVDPGKTADVPHDVDRLSPGTRVAFLVRNRLDSPYDGLWLAPLP